MRRSVVLRDAVKMIKSYKLFDVATMCSVDDSIFARKLPGGGCQFFAWPGLNQSLAVQGILSMPPHLQTVHALFGRNDVPIDICADIDCPVPPEALTRVEAAQSFQLKILEQHVKGLHAAIASEGEAIETQVCLQSPNLKKASFHIHIKLKDAAFADYRSLGSFLTTAKQKGELPYLDLQIYRPNGMLRMHKSKKENLQSAMTIFSGASQQIGFKDGKVSDAEAALHSLCTRSAGTFTRLIQKQHTVFSQTTTSTEYASTRTSEPQKQFCTAPKSKIEACENAKKWTLALTPDAVGDWKGWVAVGMSLYRVANHFGETHVPSFQNKVELELLNTWIEISKTAPHKFVPGDCEKAWATFTPEAREDSWWVSYKTLYNKAHGIGGAGRSYSR